MAISVKKLRHREIKQLALSHTARKWKSQDLYPSDLAPKASSCVPGSVLERPLASLPLDFTPQALLSPKEGRSFLKP